jgi:hypothetical protein
MLGRSMHAVLLTALTMSTIPVARANRGDVDPGYGQRGQIQAPRGTRGTNSLPDGSLIEVSSPSPTSMVVSHWDVNGIPDPAFGPGGSRQIVLPVANFPGSPPEPVGGFPGTATRTSDGKFYLWGAPTDARTGFIRLNDDGTLDQTFGTAGVLSPPGGVVEGLIVEPDGHLLVCDAVYDDFYDNALSATIRAFDQTGADDLSFGAGTGATRLPAGIWLNHFLTPFNLTGGGLIRIAPSSVSSIVYLTPDGNPSPAPVSYAGLRSDVTTWLFAGELSTGDTLVAGVSSEGAILVARVHADGTLEKSFGGFNTGYAQIPGRALSRPNYSMRSTFLSGDGHHLYVSVSPATPGGKGAALARLSTDGPAAGTLDLGFGASGVVELNSFGLQVTGVLEQPDGAALVTTYDGIAFRLLPVDAPSPGFITVSDIPDESKGAVAGPATMHVQVSRVAGRNGPISVHYSTSDLDAVAGVDYRATSGTLTWADGDVGDKTIAIEVLADTGTSPRGYKSFGLNFDSAQGTFVYGLNIELAVAAPEPGAAPSAGASSPVVSSTPAPATGAGSMDPEWLILLLICLVFTLRRRLQRQQWI